MDKPEIVLQLEKELNTTFKQVDVNKITEYKGKTAEYSLDENQNITGLCIAHFELKQIPDVLQNLLRIPRFDLKQIPDVLQNLLQNIQVAEYLTHLNFLDNQITDISAIKDLKNINYINFQDNEIIDISTIKELKNLTEINFGSNQITDISAIKELKNLTGIDFGSNQITDISALKDLKKLNYIDFQVNQITDISALKDLKKLRNISIRGNQITDISALKDLKELRDIYFLGNKISDISAIKDLKNLRGIHFSGNKISDISAIKDLKNLIHIDFMNNQINDISAIKDLKNLVQIDFFGNQITDISALKDLKKFIEIIFVGNQITDISAIKELRNLRSIYFGHNQITDISALKDLKNLKNIDFQNNKITKIEQWLTEFNDFDFSFGKTNYYDTKANFIYLFGNPIESPPIEIIKQGKEAIRNYFAQLNEVDYLFEAKLILVGEERAGKSTLAKALSQTDFKINLHELSTEGIDILRWDIPKTNTETDKDFRFNVWDFGGQEIYHNTHQFFLTKRSLYLFVSEARKDLRFDDFYYWLNIINSLAGNSPVLVVQNKCDQVHQHTDISEWKGLFPQISGNLHKISCNTEHTDWANIHKLTLELLKQQIYDMLRHKKLPGIGDRLPRAWVAVRNEIADLQQQKTPYISLQHYREICKKQGLDTEKSDFLSDYFHDLGVFLHFRHDIQLRNTVFLDYEYVTKGIYKVFDNKKIIDNFGKFTDADLIEIWDTGEFAEKQSELLNLLKNREFKICFQHRDGYYLVPQLFSERKPEIEWRTHADNLIFRYNYRFLPKGILSQLIVLLNQYIYKNMFWKSGVVLAYKNSRAIVSENRFKTENNITIRTEGSEKRDLLIIIGNAIEEINKGYTNLTVSEELACVCAECQQSETPYYWKLETINKAMQKGKQTVECQKSFIDIHINQLLGNYIPTEQLTKFAQQGGNIINIYGSYNTVMQDIKDSKIDLTKNIKN